jgi:hypothetical protein
MSLIRPYRSIDYSHLSIIHHAGSVEITPSSTWTKFPGTTITRSVAGGEYATAASWRVADSIGGLSLVSCVLCYSLDELDEEIDFGFGISGSSPTGIFVSDQRSETGRAWSVLIEAIMSLTAAQYVEPFAKIDGSATATLTLITVAMSISREQNE